MLREPPASICAPWNCRVVAPVPRLFFLPMHDHDRSDVSSELTQIVGFATTYKLAHFSRP